MAKEIFMPCDDWSEKLTMPKDELTVSDRNALESHIASCPMCMLTNIDDTMIGKLIRSLPEPDFPQGLPPRLSRLIQEKKKVVQPKSSSNEQKSGHPTDQVRYCHECNKEFEYTIGEQEFYASRGLTAAPSRCPSCRAARRGVQPDPSSNEPKSEPIKKIVQLDLSSNNPKSEHRTDQVLYCRDCNQEFEFTVGEQEFYASRGLTIAPSRCPSCRAARKAQMIGSRELRQMYTVTCASCGNETQLPFYPRSDKPVYCRDCYQSQAHGSDAAQYYGRSWDKQ